MKKLFLLLAIPLFLTGCPNEQEVQEMTDDMIAMKTQANKVINEGDFSLDGLLSAQDYFFTFGEKVHLMQADEKALENIKAFIKKKGIKQFCSDFILPVRTWQTLEDYCSSGDVYLCSLDIHEYQNTQSKLLQLIGSKNEKLFKNETECN